MIGGTTAVVLSAWIALSIGSVGIAAGAPLTTLPDPECTASAAGPGTKTVCLKEAHEGSTAAGFMSHACDHITNRNTALDYFIFVLPAAGDPSRFFTGTPTVYYTTNGTTTVTVAGVIDSNTKFFAAPTPAGATVLEAVANSNNGTGTPRGGEAQVFNLTHTCPATQPPPPDTTPPTCKLTGMGTDTTGHKFIQITVQDTGSGPGSIIVTSSNNVTTSPSLPLFFTVEDTAPFVITATKVDQTKSSTIALKVTDLANNVMPCDPVWKADSAAVARAARAARVAALAARLR
jgi:hypothetical protein